MSFAKLFPILILAGILVIGSQYMILISATTDTNSNVSEAYQEQYNTTRDINITTISLTKFLAPIIGGVALVIAIKMIGRKK